MIYCVETFGLLSFRVDAGIHWRGSIQRLFVLRSYVDHNAREAPAPANTPDLHRKLVDVDAMLLGSRPPLAPESFSDLASASRPVSFSFIPKSFINLAAFS